MEVIFEGIVSGSRLYVELAAGGPGIAGTVIYNDVVATSPFAFSYELTASQPIVYRVRKSWAPYYKALESVGTITSSGFSTVVQQTPDQ